MQYIAKPGIHNNFSIFRKDLSFENCWHCVASIDNWGVLRFSNHLTNPDEKKEVNLFVLYNDLSQKVAQKPAIFLPA